MNLTNYTSVFHWLIFHIQYAKVVKNITQYFYCSFILVFRFVTFSLFRSLSEEILNFLLFLMLTGSAEMNLIPLMPNIHVRE